MKLHPYRWFADGMGTILFHATDATDARRVALRGARMLGCKLGTAIDVHSADGRVSMRARLAPEWLPDGWPA